MEPNYTHSGQTYSYLALRKAVGWIGILLPFVLMLGMVLLFKEEVVLRNISLYYHSGMRDVFVGAICAIALFVFFYYLNNIPINVMVLSANNFFKSFTGCVGSDFNHLPCSSFNIFFRIEKLYFLFILSTMGRTNQI